ncbi:MAG: hypothetical protein COZ28_03235 [Candidatus Moranbacteria bacterium CG_4_10_14_3_um_filter_44_15]|nr:MAG: hypothetical protein COS72_04430 [Candidatus Moranbacteria bacterium CG06_land_8_20_14_3_00_43_56]PIV84289.1 MAG: hypothetical protein COW51_00855 [Candidatus Moranbacteria bacterium CG17_big_fil_post_rev_8_21_14_2_50_44_12]PIW93055.1 MAG: hypothetical protein COZ87_03345 [Candidatus Moranbacteria bacterium CG_4_8_14_3_um_filter_43_15]PIX90529.1 MAG: hypothetical protein COZ28_03235 [Candidatus Moranbacteria bacterium CG_4_10_14_3_um_filter_44_15]PJA85845.1 MAG: hypothetical protein CO1
MTKEAQKEIRQITKTVVKEYKPEKIILFGSFAYGKPKASSDIDMLIVKNTKKRKIDRIKDILFLVDSDLPFEPLVYTPKEINQRLSLGDFFIEKIISQGKILYEKG